MKYRLIDILPFLLCLIFFFSQKNQAQDCAYAKYDSLVNIARGNFKNKKSLEGVRHLKLAFETPIFPRGEDLSFALYKAREVKDNMWSLELTEKLSKGGVPKRYFFQFKNEKWYPKFEQNFESYSKFYQENFNLNLREELLLLMTKDRNYTDRYHEWRERKIEMTEEELVKETKEVLVDFEKIIFKYGFPSEKAGWLQLCEKDK